MKKVAILVAVVMALPTFVIAAEQMPVTISGSLMFNAIHRTNVSDWDDDPDDVTLFGVPISPARGPDGLLGTADDGKDDMENFVDVYAVIDLKAELADNVSVMIELANERHDSDRFGDNGFEVKVREAWVQMKEFAVPELTVKLGLQNFAYALRNDDNYFLLDTKETFQLGQDKSDIGNAVGGLKAQYDLIEKTLAAEAFWFRAVDPGVDSGWFDAYGLGLGYFFADEKSHMGLNAINFHDNTGTTDYTYTEVLKSWANYAGTWPWLGGYQPIVEGGNWWALSAGIDYFIPMGAGDLELYGEGIWETGRYSKTSELNPYKSIFEQEDELDMSAFGGRVGADMMFKDVVWSPEVAASYWYRSGDDDPSDNDQGNFVSYGKTVETLIVEDAFYGFNLNTNYEAWRLSLAVCPMEKTKVKLQYNDFSLVEGDYQEGYVPPRPFYGWPPIVVTENGSSKDFGQELDLMATYAYSENVTFMLGLGYFWPGDFITDNPREGRHHDILDDSKDDAAFLVDFRTVVTF